MGKLIDADELRDHWLYETVGNEPEFTPNDVLDSIDSMPAVDAVPVIRCRDCKHYSEVVSGPNAFGSCKYCIYPTPDDFCSHGEPVNKPVESVDNSGGVNNG